MSAFDREAVVERMAVAIHKEWAENEGMPNWPTLARAALAIAEEAVRGDEREACAVIADLRKNSGLKAAKLAARNIAACIRARAAPRSLATPPEDAR